MSSKSAIVCNRRAWETIQMAKLLMMTSCNTTACLPIARERAGNGPGGHCVGPPRWPLRREGHVGLACRPLGGLPRAEEGCPELRRAAQSWGDLPRAEGSGPELRGAAQSWGEPPRAEGSRLLPQALQDSSAGTPLHFRPLRRSTEASIRISSEPNFFPSLFHSAPYPSLAWSAGHSPLNFLQVNIWLRVCCPGILTLALTSLTPSRIILRISPVR